MNNFTDTYITYFTLIVFIIGAVLGLTHLLAVMETYSIATKQSFNGVCKEAYGTDYIMDDYNSKLRSLDCIQITKTLTYK